VARSQVVGPAGHPPRSLRHLDGGRFRNGMDGATFLLDRDPARAATRTLHVCGVVKQLGGDVRVANTPCTSLLHRRPQTLRPRQSRTGAGHERAVLLVEETRPSGAPVQRPPSTDTRC
jgi:hypothetical protein